MAYDLSDIRREIGSLAERYPAYVNASDRLFALWFLAATVAGSEARAERALTGRRNDGGLDAVFIDSDNRAVYLIQGKYHRSDDATAERNDVRGLADIARTLLDDDANPFDETAKALDNGVRDRLRDARKRVQAEGYEVYAVFLITGRVSQSITHEARARVRPWHSRADFDVFGADRLVKLMRDYQEGAAPPVPVVRLRIGASL
jgi:ElaB/YqjD/DUF883 family membrane-anchored ribosome-binding protein